MGAIDKILKGMGIRKYEAPVGVLEKTSTRHAYQGSVLGRLTHDWIYATSRSVNEEVKAEADRLRQRARDLSRNNAFATSYLEAVELNVIGPDGIRLQSRVTNRKGELAKDINTAIEAAWVKWGEPENCSADTRLSWTDIERLIVKTEDRDGECFIRMIGGYQNDFGFAIQVIDADLLDHTYETDLREGRKIKQGIEVDKFDRPIAYHFFEGHPQDPNAGGRNRIRIPASEIIHIFRTERPGQVRGVTRFASVMMDLKMFAGYQEAELVSLRTSAAKMGFLKQDAENYTDPDQGGSAGNLQITAEPGTFEILPPGFEFQAWDPTHPGGNYTDFTRGILHSIAKGLGISYATMTGDLKDVNFSSIRAGIIAERDTWKSRQRRLVMHVHRRVYREWLKWAMTKGALKLPTLDPQKYLDVAWQGRGWAWVDPMKDVQAAGLEIAMGLNSRQKLAAERGRDFEEILSDLDLENQLALEYKVTLTTGDTNESKHGGKDSEGSPDSVPAGGNTDDEE